MKDITKVIYLLAIIVCMALLLTTYLPGVHALENSQSIQWFIDEGILKGDGSGNYFLSRTITEQEATAFLLRTYKDKTAEPISLHSVSDIDKSILYGIQDLSPACCAKLIFLFENIQPYDYRMYRLDYSSSEVIAGDCIQPYSIWQSHKFDHDKNAEYLCNLWGIEVGGENKLTRGEFLNLLYKIYFFKEKDVPKPDYLNQFKVYVDKDLSYIYKLYFYDDLTFIPKEAINKLSNYRIYYTFDMGDGVVPTNIISDTGNYTKYTNVKDAAGVVYFDTKIMKINAWVNNEYKVLMHEIGHVITRSYVNSFSQAFNAEYVAFGEQFGTSGHMNKSEMLADAYSLLTVIYDKPEKLESFKKICPLTYEFMIENFDFE